MAVPPCPLHQTMHGSPTGPPPLDHTWQSYHVPSTRSRVAGSPKSPPPDHTWQSQHVPSTRPRVAVPTCHLHQTTRGRLTQVPSTRPRMVVSPGPLHQNTHGRLTRSPPPDRAWQAHQVPSLQCHSKLTQQSRTNPEYFKEGHRI